MRIIKIKERPVSEGSTDGSMDWNRNSEDRRTPSSNSQKSSPKSNSQSSPKSPSPTKVKAKILNQTLFDTAIVDSMEICQFGLGESFIFRTFQQADNIWVGIDDEDKIRGFVCVKTSFDYEDPTLEVRVLCSNKANVGKLLLQKVIAFAKENNRMTLMLHSVPHKVSYYKKFGFMVGNDCDSRDDDFTKKSDIYHNKTDTKLHFNSVKHMLYNEEAKAFLQEAATKLYTKDNCLDRKGQLDFADKMTLSCLGQGITMFLCFNSDKTPTPSPLPQKNKTPSPLPQKNKTPSPSPPPQKNKTPTPPQKNRTPPTQKKTRKKRLIKSCEQRNKETNPFTKKCTPKCKNQKVRRERDFRCVKSQTRKGIRTSVSKTKTTCEQRNKETNPFTKKCTPKCKNQKVRRARDFRCIKGSSAPR